jgi:hypothetical protein
MPGKGSPFSFSITTGTETKVLEAAGSGLMRKDVATRTERISPDSHFLDAKYLDEVADIISP